MSYAVAPFEHPIELSATLPFITKVEKYLSLQRGKTNKLEKNKKVVDMVKLAKLNNKEKEIANKL
jgi:hypothetical protein